MWGRVQAGDLEAWRARRIAEATFGLSREAAAFVDAQVAPFAHRIGIAALERLIAEAIARFMPDQAAEDARRAADGRHFTIEHQQVSFEGTSQIHGELDLADALDLDAALAAGAQLLKALGSTESLDVRRSIAAGQIARNQLTLDLATGTDQTQPERRSKPRQVVLHVHLSEAAITGTMGPVAVWSWRGWRTTAGWSPPTRSSTWCAHPDAQVVVKPVVDLNEHIHLEGYEVPDRLREQTILRDHTCVFPWCTRIGTERRCRPRHPLRRRRHHEQRQHRPRCADDIIA